jgi:oligopeptide/dipeptide ABC transporter ATP-binding protein
MDSACRIGVKPAIEQLHPGDASKACPTTIPDPIVRLRRGNVPRPMVDSSLVEVRNLVASFTTGGRRVVAVDQVSLTVYPGRTLALVGESGCGKSVTALSLLRLLPSPPAAIDSGEILFEKRNLLLLSESQMRDVRGNRIAMIFQDPMTSLNPVFTIGYQLVEAIRLHRKVTKKEAYARAIELLELVQIPSPSTRIEDYPHQLSGGMRQRVMIAMALSCDPRLLIADEPTTALDVTVQAQILELLSGLQERLNMGILFITHDLGIVAEFAQTIAVMYAGQIVEEGPVAALYGSPRHPYTAGLLASVPARVLAKAGNHPPKRLPTIEGVVPSLAALPQGCRFHDRCQHRKRWGSEAVRCEQEPPLLVPHDDENRAVRCHFPIEENRS